MHSGGHANMASGDGLLSSETPANEPADAYVYDPTHPAPTIGGATLMHPSFRAGALDQRSVEARDDVLVFTSAPVEHPLALAGPVTATLYVATDGPDTDFVARLVDVYPDGRAMTLTDGVTRLRYRDGLATPAGPVVAGHVYEIQRRSVGHGGNIYAGPPVAVGRDQQQLPPVERNPNTGDDPSQATTWRVARQTLLHDAEHPSRCGVASSARNRVVSLAVVFL